jgi:hypothetical protein
LNSYVRYLSSQKPNERETSLWIDALASSLKTHRIGFLHINLKFKRPEIAERLVFMENAVLATFQIQILEEFCDPKRAEGI